METIDLQEIHKAAFLNLNGIKTPEVRETSGRIVWRVTVDSEVQRLLMEYEGNPQVPLLDFTGCLKRLRGRMLDVRQGRNLLNENGNGERNEKSYNR